MFRRAPDPGADEKFAKDWQAFVAAKPDDDGWHAFLTDKYGPKNIQGQGPAVNVAGRRRRGRRSGRPWGTTTMKAINRGCPSITRRSSRSTICISAGPGCRTTWRSSGNWRPRRFPTSS